MTDIVISRVDAAPATFEAAKFLRLFRGTLLAPGLGILPWTTTVTIDDREPLVHTNESIQEVLDKLAGLVKICHLTAPDGTGVWVNAAQVTHIRALNHQEKQPPVFPDIEPPADAHTIFSISKFTQLVRNFPADVQIEIERAKNS